MNTVQLKAEAQKFSSLRERLKRDYQDIDDETLSDTLEGLSDLPDQLQVLIRSALEDESLVEALKIRAADMRARISRLEARTERKRALAAEVMRQAELPRLVAPDFTASARPSTPTLVVIEERLIPDAFWVPQPARLNRQELIGALKAGTVVPGVSLSDGGSTLSVRTR